MPLKTIGTHSKKNSRLYNALNTWHRSCQSLGTQSSSNGLSMDGGSEDP
ncbi:MAG: hypothetical protein F6K55_39335 [Moorea sp. SIO4A3]|nr:hypothetical protein [Moorena sp. SIO4A3]